MLLFTLNFEAPSDHIRSIFKKPVECSALPIELKMDWILYVLCDYIPWSRQSCWNCSNWIQYLVIWGKIVFHLILCKNKKTWGCSRNGKHLTEDRLPLESFGDITYINYRSENTPLSGPSEVELAYTHCPGLCSFDLVTVASLVLKKCYLNPAWTRFEHNPFRISSPAWNKYWTLKLLKVKKIK